MDSTAHWDTVYASKAPAELSWFQPEPAVSLRLIERYCPAGGTIIDVGGGASVLVDRLIDRGYRATVLDISSKALQQAQARLGPRAAKVSWIMQDIIAGGDVGVFDLWHDRAVFHFLTDAEHRRTYAACAARSVHPNGCVIIATFGPHGPTKCSGLDVRRYDAGAIAAEMGEPFRLVDQEIQTHRTPQGKDQQFVYAVLRRI